MVNNCNRVNIYFNVLVSGVETVNSKSLTIVCNEFCPSINIDKTDGCQISLMKDRNTEIITAKSSEMNVSYPNKAGDEMEKETPIPEQFVTRWNAEKGKFETTTYESV